jgi:hypothetical protein
MSWTPIIKIVVKEFGRMLTIGADAAHLGGQVNDHLGLESSSICLIESIWVRSYFSMVGMKISLRAAFNFSVTKEPKNPAPPSRRLVFRSDIR